MRQLIEKLMAEHGTDMAVKGSAGIYRVRGFFQPINTHSWQSIEREATLLGEFDRGQYRYIGPGDVPVQEGDTLAVGKKNYLVRRVEPYYYGNDILYLWGLCVEKGVNDFWTCLS
jgi:hypothetical protein